MGYTFEFFADGDDERSWFGTFTEADLQVQGVDLEVAAHDLWDHRLKQLNVNRDGSSAWPAGTLMWWGQCTGSPMETEPEYEMRIDV